MVEICPLALGVRLVGICFIRPDRLENCAGVSSPDWNQLLAAQPCAIGSESYSHLSGAGYPVRPRAQRTPGFIESFAKSSPQRQARIVVTELNRQGMTGCTAFARNTFRIRTYKKMGAGVASPSPSENSHSAAKHCTINTYAKPKAKYHRMCTCEKNEGGGYPSPWFRYAA